MLDTQKVNQKLNEYSEQSKRLKAQRLLCPNREELLREHFFLLEEFVRFKESVLDWNQQEAFKLN